MRIAVASKSGTEIDQHFGHAERFLIYDCHGGEVTLVSEVEVEKFCYFDPEEPHRQSRFQAIATAISGCRAVLTAMIGDHPRQELTKAGILAISTSGPIEAGVRSAHEVLCGSGCGCADRSGCP